jgi:hypothetical protein
MKSTIFLPKTIKVGYQKRRDTYTEKLAYIIYYDEKNVLRKENSWNGWRDKGIPEDDFRNVPTSGFVLNKKTGDYKSDWNHRMAHIRVYDPRGFEFEITVDNLLYILENSNSIKGKGLEGEFVYGWEGKELILIPINSPDYQELTDYNKILHENNYIKPNDLIIGATYKTKALKDLVYLGRFDYYGTKTNDNDVDDYNTEYEKPVKHFYFGYLYDSNSYIYIEHFKSISQKFISIVDENCSEHYSQLFKDLEHKDYFSPIDSSKTKKKYFTLQELEELEESQRAYGYYNIYLCEAGRYRIYCTIKDNPETTKWFFESYRSVYSKPTESTPEEIIQKLKPYKIKIYLQNGNLFRERIYRGH